MESVSQRERARLRPAVLRDLGAYLRLLYNGEPKPADIEDEFQHCHFTSLRLGTLGSAILVEAEAGHGKTNAAMLNIYAPSHGSYRQIAAAMGFGPIIVRGPAPVPDLVFGWSSGVCHTTYQRYHYEHGRYAADACNQEDYAPDTNSCIVKSCAGKLPTFPSPTDGASQ